MIPEPSRLSDKEFDQFAELIWQKARIHLKPAKITLLSNRLRRRLRVLELDDYKAYLEYIKAPANASELVNMLDVVTTNETYFFRNMLHWNALLEGSIVKDILKNRKPRVMKAWSAGCSSGEEPYNLAIVLTEAMKTQLHFDFSVEATDLSTNMIKKAKKGEYSGRTLEKIPSNFMKRYFEPVEENEVASIFTLRDDIKK